MWDEDEHDHQRIRDDASSARVPAVRWLGPDPAPRAVLVERRKDAANGNGKAGTGTVTLSLGTTNVAFKIQEDAPSCAECGSIMVRNGSCYKCLNCGSTSGCS
jgi:tRNA(Ile2) C34 agmatinyltransferase TiaS